MWGTKKAFREEFAYQKIIGLINKLKSEKGEESLAEEKQQNLTLIKMIGESVLVQKLKSMYRTRYPEDVAVLKEEIQKLEERVRQLEEKN